MSTNALIDNDVLIKGACYGLLAELAAVLPGAGGTGVLATAKYVVRDQLARGARVSDRVKATASWESFLADVEEVEPTPDEVDLATTLEEAASERGAALDGGESLLCAVAIARPVPWVVTGDKRAIVALEQLLSDVQQLAELRGRVVSLEQIIEALMSHLNPEEIRAAICAEPDADQALTVCSQCGRHDGILDPEGLRSYIADVRTNASSLLAGALDL